MTALDATGAARVGEPCCTTGMTPARCGCCGRAARPCGRIGCCTVASGPRRTLPPCSMPRGYSSPPTSRPVPGARAPGAARLAGRHRRRPRREAEHRSAPSWSGCAGRTGCRRWRSWSSSGPVPTSPGRPLPAQGIDRLVHELVADGIDVAVALPGAAGVAVRLPPVARPGAQCPCGCRRAAHRHHHRGALRLPRHLRRTAGARRAPPGLCVCGRKRVARLLRAAGLAGVSPHPDHQRAERAAHSFERPRSRPPAPAARGLRAAREALPPRRLRVPVHRRCTAAPRRAGAGTMTVETGSQCGCRRSPCGTSSATPGLSRGPAGGSRWRRPHRPSRRRRRPYPDRGLGRCRRSA